MKYVWWCGQRGMHVIVVIMVIVMLFSFFTSPYLNVGHAQACDIVDSRTGDSWRPKD